MADVTVVKEPAGLIPAEDVEFLIKFDEMQKRAKVITETIKAQYEEWFEENGVDSVDNGRVHIYRTKPYTKKMVDTEALKDLGIYEYFLKNVEVKGSVKIDIKYDD